MTSRTVRERASATVGHGNADFTVLSAGPSAEDTTMFVVVTPMALTRLGWRLTTTRFGADLIRTLYALQGVEPNTQLKAPHVIVIFVDNKTGEEPMLGSRNALRGLPGNISVAIQEVILRNRGPIQRFAERLRRLI